jgi:hypothetical protein
MYSAQKDTVIDKEQLDKIISKLSSLLSGSQFIYTIALHPEAHALAAHPADSAPRGSTSQPSP